MKSIYLSNRALNWFMWGNLISYFFFGRYFILYWNKYYIPLSVKFDKFYSLFRNTRCMCACVFVRILLSFFFVFYELYTTVITNPTQRYHMKIIPQARDIARVCFYFVNKTPLKEWANNTATKTKLRKYEIKSSRQKRKLPRK